MDAFWFFAGVAAYYKLDGVRLEKERVRDDAIEQLRRRAQSLQDELDNMEFEQTLDPDTYTERQMESAQRRADRAQEAFLMAQAECG